MKNNCHYISPICTEVTREQICTIFGTGIRVTKINPL